tara:strand:+ start:968 stop:1459 length:492 start_codon:yes stop_codon:yes gene_type:complete
LAACLSLALLVASCSRAGAKVEQPSQEELTDEPQREYCGGDMPEGTMVAYFDRLDRQLKHSTGPVPLDFYTDTIALTEHGKSRWFRAADMGPQAERLPTLDDWREISRRGANRIEGAGYRGCFFSSGKAWFSTTYPDGRFGLMGFNKDMPWTADGVPISSSQP